MIFLWIYLAGVALLFTGVFVSGVRHNPVPVTQALMISGVFSLFWPAFMVLALWIVIVETLDGEML
jgi:hypothetical protein